MPAASRGPNAVTGKRPVGRTYASSTVAHSETVIRGFYCHHLEAGTGPLVNPFPLARARQSNAHHNPMDPWKTERSGPFRPRQPQRIPRQIPDQLFNELFAQLSSHRDRALVAFWISTGARASELLSVLCCGADPGRQLVTVVRKGSCDSPLLAPTLDRLEGLGPLPDTITVHLNAGYDSDTTRALLSERGLRGRKLRRWVGEAAPVASKGRPSAASSFCQRAIWSGKGWICCGGLPSDPSTRCPPGVLMPHSQAASRSRSRSAISATSFRDTH